jgi:hypothetical protein
MPTVAELTVAEEMLALREIAAARGWVLRDLDTLRFHLTLPAKDKSLFHLLVDCDQYKVRPPAWRWCDASGEHADRPADRPKGSGYLHPGGVICAPWNRLAYKAVDPGGPHEDWRIGDWLRNPQTAGCSTLAHMALRIYIELNGPRFEGNRLG